MIGLIHIMTKLEFRGQKPSFKLFSFATRFFSLVGKGRRKFPKWMNFWKIFKQPLTPPPPPLISESYIGFRDKSASVHMEGHLCII